MSRTVQIALAPELTEQILAEVQTIDGVTGIRLQRGISLKPPGDLLSVDLTNPGLAVLMQRLEQHGLGEHPGASISTSEMLSSISAPAIGEVARRETSDATWEEMETSLLKESNTTANTVLLMFCAGVMATIGVATETLHTVIAAMLIAPGFEPLTRIGLGLVGRSKAAQRGLADLVRLYLALVLGVIVTTLVLFLLNKASLMHGGTYLPPGALVRFWTTLSLTSILVSTAASIAGAVLIASNRSVLTAGVMVGLSLIPSLTVATMGLVLGEWQLSVLALLRWLIDLVLVVALSVVVFAWKWRTVQGRRRMLL